MIKFLSDEINEPIVQQYLETCPKSAAYILQILVTQY